MLYYLFTYLDKFDVPGAGMFQYISFRSGLSLLTALLISLIWGKRIINLLQKKQIGEIVRELGLEGQYKKQGTPTMGGVIILTSIIIPALLFTDLKNIYIILILVTTVWLGLVGFLDDYIKVFKKNKKGLYGWFKIAGQVGVGLIVGLTLHFNSNVLIQEKLVTHNPLSNTEITHTAENKVVTRNFREVRSTKTTIPFFKDNEFDYAKLLNFLGKEKAAKYAWIVLVIAVIIIVTAVSNGANMTDGLDGLAAGTSAIIGTTLGILAYLSGNIIYADYLNIMYIPYAGELVIFMSAFIGAIIGFLWYNSFPAQVFMGDTGSLSLGGIIAVFAIMIRKELLIPILCGVFFVESISVMLQVSWFKYTKRKYGAGRRIFKMAPLHHHYQLSGYTEPKIVTRFWIVGILLAVVTIVTLKVR